jgi:hypothetical protein
MEVDQEFLIFLNAVQLKILWSMLTFTFTACFTLFYDLQSPFGGSYQICPSVDQLYPIRATLKEALCQSLLQNELKDNANATITSSNEELVRHRLN